MTNVGAIEDIIDGIIADNSEQVEQFKAGNTKLLGYFVGQVMKANKDMDQLEMLKLNLKQCIPNSKI